MAKVKITRGTTIAGKDVKAGEVIDVDPAVKATLISQNQAEAVVEKQDEKKK